MELHTHGINCTHLLEIVLNLFVWTKLNFSFLYLIYSHGGYNRNKKPAPCDQESNFKKVGAIPCGCNTK